MIITVLNVSTPEKVVKGKATYYTIEVAYKNEKGQTQGKKLMSFSVPSVYEALKEAQGGETWDITVEKQGEYWNWVGAKKSDGASKPTNSTSTQSTGRSGGSYETAEERAARQRLIVRQSSLSAAVATLTVGAKSVDKEAVKALAEEYNSWVFEEKPSLKEAASFDDFDDDIPM